MHQERALQPAVSLFFPKSSLVLGFAGVLLPCLCH